MAAAAVAHPGSAPRCRQSVGSFPITPKLFILIFAVFQELLSHSSDRPEKQQLKEALEAMQVRAALGSGCNSVRNPPASVKQKLQ